MSNFKCKVCGYVYDSEKGEPKRDIAAGTQWNDIPDGFKCPSCGAAKRMFKEI